METLIFAALIVFLLLITVRALSSWATPPPQIVIVQAEPPAAPGLGCLPLLLVGLLAILLVVGLGG